MTINEFVALCMELMIGPEFALENENVQEALRTGGDVRKVLEEEF